MYSSPGRIALLGKRQAAATAANNAANTVAAAGVGILRNWGQDALMGGKPGGAAKPPGKSGGEFKPPADPVDPGAGTGTGAAADAGAGTGEGAAAVGDGLAKGSVVADIAEGVGIALLM